MNFTDRIILTAYRCIKEGNFDCKLQTLPHLIAFVANSIGGVFLKHFLKISPHMCIRGSRTPFHKNVDFLDDFRVNVGNADILKLVLVRFF